jgi:hypothetical protein
MRGGCLSFVISLAALALLVCLIWWIFITDFLIFDILLVLGQIALYIIIAMVIIVIIVWIIKELFG